MASQEAHTTPPQTPVVSVAVTAYNLAKWLPRALDSALEQRTPFPIEIVIGDDCSQDATLGVAHSYQERYPDVIRVLERSTNVGIQRNTYETFEQCRGKFIAWLDADDYWTDPEKLAIQVETLESDPSINVCCHFVRWVTSDGEIKRDKSPLLPAGRYGLDQILRRCFIPTPSVMFRSGLQRLLPAWYFTLGSLSDWPMWVLSSVSGDIVVLDRVMAAYMLTPGSSFSSKGDLFWNKMDAEFYEQIESLLPLKWHRLVRAEKGKRYESIAYWARKQGDYSTSREAALKAFGAPFLMDNCASKAKTLLASLVGEAEWRLRGGRTAPAK
jgi:glycosyltransferase involved in cell wall biosynthesis